MPRGAVSSRCAANRFLPRSFTGVGRLVPHAVLLLMLAACRTDSRTSFVVRDSAGVTIAESADTAPARWKSALEPAVEIGADPTDTADALYDVGGVTRLGDGRIVLTDGGTAEIRSFTPTGDRLATAGGKGEGPGEFRSLSRPYRLRGDSLLVYDASLRRLSVFDRELRFIRQFRLIQVPGGSPVSPVLVVGGAEILARPGFSFGKSTPEGLHQAEIGYLRFRTDGTFIDSVGRFPGTETLVINNGASSMAISLAYLPQPRVAAGADGFVFGAADRFEITRYAPDGRPLTVIRLPGQVAPFTAERKRWYHDLMLADSKDDQRQFFERVLEAAPPGDALPAFDQLVVDSDRDLWVRDFSWQDEESANWRVFAPDGRLVASVETPSRFEVHEIGPDWMLGIWQDDLGVESVRLYPLDRDASNREIPD